MLTIQQMIAKLMPKPTKARRTIHRVEKMDARCTARKCVECHQPASWWRFFGNQKGGADLSSRQPVCSIHTA